MKITVKVITRAKKTELISLSDTEFKAKLTAIPEKGKAGYNCVDRLSWFQSEIGELGEEAEDSFDLLHWSPDLGLEARENQGYSGIG